MRTRRRWSGVIALGLAGAVATAPAGCRSNEMHSDPGVPGVPGRVEQQERSPLLATVLAIFPGIIVHGIGNLYAGDTDKAEDLMAEEGLGIVCLGASAGLLYLAYTDNGHAEHQHGTEQVLTRIGEVTEYVGGGLAGIVGVGTFFHSWIRDMLDAGAAAEKHNIEVRRLYDEQIHPIPANKSAPPWLSPGAPAKPHPDDGAVPGGVAPIVTPTAPTQNPGKH